MAKFNQSNTVINKTPNSTNAAGGVAFTRDFEKEVASLILNSMISGNNYYESEEDRITRIEDMFTTDNVEDQLFLAKAMVYTRNEGNLRSVTHLVANVLSESVKGQTFMKNAIEKCLIRPDDATEMVALWNQRHQKSIPNAMRKAIKSALENRWKAYHLKKYFGNGKVKVSNLINITHPTPKDDVQRLTFKQALEGDLPNIQTAQTINAGSEDRAQSYEKALREKSLGYMAALKNIKNILESNPSGETIDMLCALLRNENAVKGSRVLPFRFTQAYNMVGLMEMDRIINMQILQAIEDGFILSAKNITLVDEGEKVALLLDESGSMGGWGEFKPNEDPFSIGKTLMASMLCGLDKSKTVGYLWADTVRQVSVDEKPMQFIKNTLTQGGGTDLGAAFTDLIKSKTYVDKIVIFTDMQQNDIGGAGSWGGRKTVQEMVKEYKSINPNVKILFWNLQGYQGGSPMKLNHDVLEVSGYSDKILSVIGKIWKDENALVNEIKAIEL